MVMGRDGDQRRDHLLLLGHSWPSFINNVDLNDLGKFERNCWVQMCINCAWLYLNSFRDWTENECLTVLQEMFLKTTLKIQERAAEDKPRRNSGFSPLYSDLFGLFPPPPADHALTSSTAAFRMVRWTRSCAAVEIQKWLWRAGRVSPADTHPVITRSLLV